MAKRAFTMRIFLSLLILLSNTFLLAQNRFKYSPAVTSDSVEIANLNENIEPDCSEKERRIQEQNLINDTELPQQTNSIRSPHNTNIEELLSPPLHIFWASDKELIAIQLKNLNNDNLEILMEDSKGAIIKRDVLYQGSTIAYFETQTLYSGDYIIKVVCGNELMYQKITITK